MAGHHEMTALKSFRSTRILGMHCVHDFLQNCDHLKQAIWNHVNEKRPSGRNLTVRSPWSSQAPRGGRNPSQRPVALRQAVLDQTRELQHVLGCCGGKRDSKVLANRTDQ